MKAFNFEQRKESELQKFVGLKGNMVEWRYGYVEKKIEYTLKTQGEKPMNITTRDFLQMLYGKCTEGCITITTLPDSRNEHISVTELDKAAERIKVLGTSANTYYCVALRQEGLPSSVRGGIGQIHTVVCMVADVDVLGSAHKENALPKTEEEAIDFVNSLKLKPSIIVRSGNGVHAIWLLDEPFVIRNENEREQIRELSAGFGMYVIAEGRKKGWKLDNVQDIPRMLRAPGSLNFKSGPPKQCEVRASARSVFSFRIVLSLKSWISIALTTETKKAGFLQCQRDRSPVRTGMFHYNTNIASQFFEGGCQLFQVTVRVVNLERPKCDSASGSPYRNCAFALRHIDTDGGNNSSFHFSDLL